jgi:hypothetical protein
MEIHTSMRGAPYRVFRWLASAVFVVGCGSSGNAGSPTGNGTNDSGGGGGSEGNGGDHSGGSGNGSGGTHGAPSDGGDLTEATTAADASEGDEVASHAADASGDACSNVSPLAFPGAVGFGASATGGRGSAAYHVTNLNDSGTGSFRDAVSTAHRTIVFDVGGIINLASAVSVSSELTIAGQSAPGGGIAVEGREVSFSNSSNIIVRNVRFRQGTDDPDSGKSTIAADTSMSLILDHVSIEFGQWDNLDVNSGMNVTIQRSIIADPIGQQFNAHCTSGDLTWYEDIFSSAHNRGPLAKGDTQFVENVVYNFQAGYTAGNSSGTFTHDIVNNYFISGPSTTSSSDAYFQMNNQSVYQSGDELDSNRDGALNGAALGLPGGATALSAPWSPTTNSIVTSDATTAYTNDVTRSGALPRDDVDALVLADVTSLGTAGHLWTSQSQTGLANGGYGTLAGGTPPVDSDGDGIPDTWETAHGLNPNNASDAIETDPCTGYTYLEEYLNQLADSLM